MLRYLNEFRTQQCLLFLEQQCQFHRPYTCFHWHFPNQKRRRPHKRIDGTFNYNPDVYCDKYDETSGSCVDGDFCPLHRLALQLSPALILSLVTVYQCRILRPRAQAVRFCLFILRF
ncbi:uncharacterized protein DEA37_0001983 [Paragonimus westermani]|uniref:Unkempt zinc finger domain-containing protein n=1 Tax=Paragonimus westermani TaxID=34504 RepID=A0A5J4NU09_9TREM|nr:uncharacterized protein DEA37_0001983 [Paragonimus westermani]